MGRRLEPAVSRARRAVRDSLCDGGPAPDHALVLVGLSGGADSLALSAAAAFVAPRLGLRWGAVVVDHALQPGSGAVAATAAAQAARLGADPVRLVRVDVVDPSDAGAEAAARIARYDALAAAAADSGATAVLVAHTRDDQAETVLIGLARGSGARSLAGMRGASDLLPVPLLRPFLDLTRADTVAVCAAEHLTPWSDPHNADRAHLRSRVRADVLPVLEQHLGPGVRDALARTARLLGDDADLLDALAARLYDVARARDAAGDPAGVVLRVDALAGAPRALRRRALRLAALAAGAPGTDLGSVHVEAVDRLVTRWHGQRALDLPGRVVVRRTGDSVRFTRPV